MNEKEFESLSKGELLLLLENETDKVGDIAFVIKKECDDVIVYLLDCREPFRRLNKKDTLMLFKTIGKKQA